MLKAGPALERTLKDKSTVAGAAVAMEAIAIEDWLEIELGASRMSGRGRQVDAVELIFKKPFRLSSTAEVMIGLGPEIGRTSRNGATEKSKSITFDLDFMFWPGKKVGWFLEPTYSYGIGPSRGECSLGIAVGILFGW